MIGVYNSSPKVGVFTKSLTRIVLIAFWGGFLIKLPEASLQLWLDIILPISKLGGNPGLN